jgi:hypothetical protein
MTILTDWQTGHRAIEQLLSSFPRRTGRHLKRRPVEAPG